MNDAKRREESTPSYVPRRSVFLEDDDEAFYTPYTTPMRPMKSVTPAVRRRRGKSGASCTVDDDCQKQYICNDVSFDGKLPSYKCVQKSGAIGKAVLAKRAEILQKNIDMPLVPSPSPSPIRSVDKSQLRIRQSIDSARQDMVDLAERTLFNYDVLQRLRQMGLDLNNESKYMDQIIEQLKEKDSLLTHYKQRCQSLYTDPDSKCNLMVQKCIVDQTDKCTREKQQELSSLRQELERVKRQAEECETRYVEKQKEVASTTDNYQELQRRFNQLEQQKKREEDVLNTKLDRLEAEYKATVNKLTEKHSAELSARDERIAANVAVKSQDAEQKIQALQKQLAELGEANKSLQKKLESVATAAVKAGPPAPRAGPPAPGVMLPPAPRAGPPAPGVMLPSAPRAPTDLLAAIRGAAGKPKPTTRVEPTPVTTATDTHTNLMASIRARAGKPVVSKVPVSSKPASKPSMMDELAARLRAHRVAVDRGADDDDSSDDDDFSD